jgi:hypothetical protein
MRDSKIRCVTVLYLTHTISNGGLKGAVSLDSKHQGTLRFESVWAIPTYRDASACQGRSYWNQGYMHSFLHTARELLYTRAKPHELVVELKNQGQAETTLKHRHPWQGDGRSSENRSLSTRQYQRLEG